MVYMQTTRTRPLNLYLGKTRAYRGKVRLIPRSFIPLTLLKKDLCKAGKKIDNQENSGVQSSAILDVWLRLYKIQSVQLFTNCIYVYRPHRQTVEARRCPQHSLPSMAAQQKIQVTLRRKKINDRKIRSWSHCQALKN